MPTRPPIVGGNWKMNTNRRSAEALAAGLADSLADPRGVEVFICPPFPYLTHVHAAIKGSEIRLAAQDMAYQQDGAFTGEVSAAMLNDCGASFVLVGHSERRHVIGETDQIVNLKTRAALQAGLRPVLCVGEKLEEREAGSTDSVNERQLRAALAGVSTEQMRSVVIAYEPVWAIGTGKTATPQDAQAAHQHIRKIIEELFDNDTARATRIQYGGSMKPANAAELLAQPDVDGGLIGGASLNADDFTAIVNAAAKH